MTPALASAAEHPISDREGLFSQRFPAGGRPFEWRALAERSAFEKLFEREYFPGRESAMDHNADGEAFPKAALAADEPAASESILDVLLPQMIPEGTIHTNAARPATANLPIQTAPKNSSLNGMPAASTILMRVEQLPRNVSDASRTEARMPVRWQLPVGFWTAIAVTAVIREGGIHVWLRDYSLASSAGLDLARRIGTALQGSGMNPEQVVINGKCLWVKDRAVEDFR